MPSSHLGGERGSLAFEGCRILLWHALGTEWHGKRCLCFGVRVYALRRKEKTRPPTREPGTARENDARS